MSDNGILILSPDADEYVALLDDIARRGGDLAAATDADAARRRYSGQPVVLGRPDLIAAVLDDLPEVRWVQSTWAGVTPLLNAPRRDYALTGVKDTFGQQMGEYLFGYLLAHELKIFQRRDQQRRKNWWEGESGILRGKTLGLMGTGSIGAYIAWMASAFGLRVIGLSLSGSAVEGFERVFPLSRLKTFLAEPDYLCAVLPDTAASRRLLDEDAFRVMKNHCYLVNIGRGNLVDEEALAAALAAGEIAGAALDVFEREPLPQDSPLWEAPGLLVTAHIAAKSWPEDITRIFRENYRRYLAEEPLLFRIDFDKGY